MQNTVLVATGVNKVVSTLHKHLHTQSWSYLPAELQASGAASTAPLQSSGRPPQGACSALLVQWYVEAATPAAAVLVGQLLRDGAQGLLQQLQLQMDAAVSCVKYAASPGTPQGPQSHGARQPSRDR